MIDEFLTQNFQRLKTLSRKVAGSRHEELFSHAVENLYTSQVAYQIAPKGETHLLKYTTAMMKRSWKHQTSSFYRYRREEPNGQWEEQFLGLHKETYAFEFGSTLYTEELLRLGFNDCQIEKILKIRSKFSELSPLMKSLFHSYFIKDKSIREIARANGISSTSVFNFLKQLKSQLKE